VWTVAGGGGGEERKELSFPELVAALYRRRWLLLAGVTLGGLAGIGAVLAIPPVYTAQALVLLEPRAADASPAAGSSTMPGSAALDAGVVDSQTRILASRSLAREVIDRLGLAADPELTADPGRLARLADRLAGAAQAAAPTAPGAAKPDPVGRFLDRLSVRRDGKSYVIVVGYRSGEPGKAARVANTVAELYRSGQRAQKMAAALRAQNRLNEQRELARLALEEAEARLRAFRAATEAARGDGLGVKELELAELNRQLVLAAAERTARETRLVRLREEGGDAGADGASPVLQNLGALKAELLRKEAELASRYGDRHPKLQDLRAERAELDARIAEERRARLRDLDAEVAAARARERTLAAGLEALKGKALRQDEAARGAGELEREVELNRRLYEGLVERASAVADLALQHEPDARVISEAVPPATPAFPKPNLLVSLGATAGLTLALVLLYLLESRDRGLLDAADVQATLGLPALALVPELPAAKVGGAAPQDHALEKPRSRYAEALRDVLASLLPDAAGGGDGRGGGGGAARGRVVLLTSALPDEGKSTLALSLGRLAASEGLRAIAVDLDLRRPSLHALAGLKPGPGVVELLRGEVGPEAVVQADPRSELRLLPASGRLGQPTRLLGPDRLGRLLDLLRTRFDLVILDAAPLAAVADARLLAPLADRTLLLVRHGATRGELCAAAAAGLRAAGPGIAGVVLTRVDPRRQRRREADRVGAAASARLARYYAD
jgi:polysaccharide biosynthesis transport protein